MTQIQQHEHSQQCNHHHEAGSDHQHGHEHNHEHNHEHGQLPVILFFVGLAAYLGALVLPLPSVLANTLYVLAMLGTGYHIIEEGVSDTISQTKRHKKFTPNVHILMTLAALGAMLIGDFQEGALLIVIFGAAHFLEEYAEGKSKREITNLMKLNPTEARLLQADGSTSIVPVTSLKIGDQLQVLNGDQIPTDGRILSGYSAIDEASISGESIPREKTVGDDVFGSTINGTGSFTMEVTKDSQDTLFAQIIQLVNQSQGNLTKTATKIKQVEPTYVKIVLALVPLVILAGPFVFGWTWVESFYRGMVFLTVASPCALAASAVPATLSAISNLAKRGVLFKGGSYLSLLADVKAVAFDKTGTLTAGKPQVTDVFFTTGDATMEARFIDVIVAMEKTANHPLANAILAHFTDRPELDVAVENQIGRGLVATYEGQAYQIGKPEIFSKVPAEITTRSQQYAQEGKTVVYFSHNERVQGVIAMMDVPNEAAKGVIAYLKAANIHTTMITGDGKVTGEAIGRQLGMDEIIGDVLPENKAAIIAAQQEQYGLVAMLGDGVNDAPALVTADIGVAMGEGTDIAMDVADAVLMKNDLTKLTYAHRVAKRLDRIVWQNVYFSMGIVLFLVILNFMGQMSLPLGIIAHEGSTLVVIFNGLRLLAPLKDN